MKNSTLSVGAILKNEGDVRFYLDLEPLDYKAREFGKRLGITIRDPDPSAWDLARRNEEPNIRIKTHAIRNGDIVFGIPVVVEQYGMPEDEDAPTALRVERRKLRDPHWLSLPNKVILD